MSVRKESKKKLCVWEAMRFEMNTDRSSIVLLQFVELQISSLKTKDHFISCCCCLPSLMHQPISLFVPCIQAPILSQQMQIFNLQAPNSTSLPRAFREGRPHGGVESRDQAHACTCTSNHTAWPGLHTRKIKKE
jgi:hypothetical protein